MPGFCHRRRKIARSIFGQRMLKESRSAGFDFVNISSPLFSVSLNLTANQPQKKNDIKTSFFLAGRSTTSEELEEMIETGNPAIFTQGVSSLSDNISSKNMRLCYHAKI